MEAQLAISNFEQLIKKWNAEHREILDDAEKTYLSAVIKPFKQRMTHIIKKSVVRDEEYLQIGVSENDEHKKENERD